VAGSEGEHFYRGAIKKCSGEEESHLLRFRQQKLASADAIRQYSEGWIRSTVADLQIKKINQGALVIVKRYNNYLKFYGYINFSSKSNRNFFGHKHHGNDF
jgi:hypothetical protein